MNKFIVTDAEECIGCHACEIACALAHNHHQWPEKEVGLQPRIRVIANGERSTAVTCRHCNDAPCVPSCPVAALRMEGDTVQLDQRRCIGCKNCVLACPFGAIDMVPVSGRDAMLAEKCDLCAQVEGGSACVKNCPTQALSVMDERQLLRLRQQRMQATASGEWPQARKTPGRGRALVAKAPRKGAGKHDAAERKGHFAEIYYPLSEQEAGFESQRCLYCSSKASCNWTCPLHNSIPDFVRLVGEGKIIEAAELCHQTSSLPEICGRVCPQDRLCEGACTLKTRSGSVTVGNLERYITDTALAMGWRPTIENVSPRRERVAIIGAGPAGLGCADILARAGVQVDVFDRHPEIGGLLTFGIPPFKLDKQVLALRREIFSQMGIQFHLNCEIGEDIAFQQLHDDYDAVFVGIGTYGLMKAGLEHEEAPGVVQALPLLIASTREVMGLEPAGDAPWVELKDKHVVVLGGGDTAMDCLRTSVRREAKSVTCAYRRDEASMPGSKKEVTNAREEGVDFQFNVQPQRIVLDKKGQVAGIELIRTRMGAPGPDGRRRPQPIAGSEFTLQADVLVMAFGFQPHRVNWPGMERVSRDKWGLITTGGQGRLRTQTSDAKVFAGGDAVHGADLVVTAMAAGRQAARDMLTLFEEVTP